ncbi:transportin MOS14 [Selaginella moellendorffii]|uniref:transportin MOS14 n=1 Tax=Selaginella moellendorffii TaxID=88036 RepID=UPI000D1C8028|nr:transportin MOS14 [Selaginella moellendorffii]XP_024544224.1 transportin MOS14 [Selaginella moellendorffii]|eukprot:XP_024544223.1 transportin MOS14 [Selaginella moellendorffii]
MGLRETLQEALQALYHHPDPEVHSNANRWLDDFQHGMDAWGLSDSLLHDPSSSLEVSYFCAQTLRTKIERDFEDLPSGAPASLRSSLMNLLVKFNQGPPLVRTQLCLAMAALAIHMPSEEWGGVGVVKWLGLELGSNPNAALSLLELLAVLPQEAYGTKVTARPERRRQFQKELAMSVQDAFALLGSCLRSSDGLREQVLEALAAWLRLSNGIPANVLALHPLVQTALSSLQSEQNFVAAVDAVSELIRYTITGCPEDVAVHMPLVQILVPCVMGLRPRFAVALKSAVSEKQAKENGGATAIDETDEDDETVKGIAYLFAEMGEAYVGLIASGTNEAIMIVEALVEVTSHPDYPISSMTFNFWHRLSRALTKRENYSAFGSEAAGEAERERRLAIFRPYYRLLVSLVSSHVAYPPDFKSWRRGEDADFRETRADVAHMLIDVTVVLGGQETLGLLAEPLTKVSIPADKNEWNWRPTEALLYCIRAIAKTVSLWESTLMPTVMTLLPQLPTIPEVLYTSCLTVGAFADWLGAFQSSKTLLPTLLEMLIGALCVGESPAAAAALALKHVCDACRTQLTGSIESLLAVFRQVMSGEDKKKFLLDSEGELQLVEGLSMVVSALPPEQLFQALQHLCYPVITPLQQLILISQAGTDTTSSQYTILIDKLANIYRYVTQPEPLAMMFSGMWPILETVFSQKAADVRTMERLCRACKYAVRSCGKAMLSSMGPMLGKIQHLFQEHNHPCFLYLASEAIKVFGADPNCAVYLSNLISVLFMKTLSLLKSIKDFTEMPDLADDCFLLGSRCIRYCPHLLVPMEAVFGPLLDCAITGITIQHREACRSILTFLKDVIELCISPGGKPFQLYIDNALLPRGPALTRVLIAALAGALPTSRLDEVISVILSLARLYGQKVASWAQDAATLVPSSIVTDNEKASFLQAVSLAGSGAEQSTVTPSLEEISDVCRRSKKVQEAVQLALRPSELTLSPLAC